jgi:hypothetical protein
VIKMKKANIIAAILIAAIAIVSAMPSIMAETEGAKLELTDFYPASLTYEVGEELAVVCMIYNSGTEVIEDATVCINVISPNGTYVYDFSYDIGEEGFEPNTKKRSLSRYLWEVDENATEGRYTIEAVLRWGSETIQKNTFFYVPEEPVQTEPGLEIVSLYTQRVLYQPGDDILCTCRMKNERNESIAYYLSMCIFDHNGTMIRSIASDVYSRLSGEKAANRFIFSAISEPGMYTIEAILWWDDTATAKTASFGIDN